MNEPAVVLAAFGVSNPLGLDCIMNIVHRTRTRFDSSPVRLAFTSNQIRNIWQRRAGDREWLAANPGVPDEILDIRGPLAAVANLQDAGHRDIVVQSLHVYAGEEYFDLKAYVDGLNSIRTAKPRWMPFNRLVLGRPALGAPGPAHPYQHDLERAARALADDARLARDNGAALVYAGHGNPVFSTGVYLELELVLRRMFPGLEVFIGAVEGLQGLDYTRSRLRNAAVGRLLLKPLMVVAGEHAREDICGTGDSWRSALLGDGYEVECVLEGLGEKDAWAGLYVENALQVWEA